MDDREKLKRDLLRKAMKGQWSKVVEIYKSKAWTHKEKITRSGETALHIAVSDGQTKIVKKLIEAIKSQTDDQNHAKEAVSVKNKQGNTALHLAASKEKEPIMCKSIAEVNSSLVGCRNHQEETPFFLAAFHGKKRAFFCLHQICANTKQDGYGYSARKDGNTTLHCAINGQHFDLAFQIIHLYPKLANIANNKGLYPLHILAAKPSAFRSGKPLGGIWHRAIYNRIFVDELKPEQPDHEDDISASSFKQMIACLVPRPCGTKATGDVIYEGLYTDRTATATETKDLEYSGTSHHAHGGIHDELDDHTYQTATAAETSDAEYSGTSHHAHGVLTRSHGTNGTGEGIHDELDDHTNQTATAIEINDPEYSGTSHHAHGGTFSSFFKLISSKAMWIISLSMLIISLFLYILTSEFKGMLLLPFGIKGYSRRRRMEHIIRSSFYVKQKHTWAVQIMNKLLEQTELYQAGFETWASVAAPKDRDSPKSTGSDHESNQSSRVDQASFETRASVAEPKDRDSTKSTDNDHESNQSSRGEEDRETPLLTAAKYGVIEMVEKILELYPIAIYDVTSVTQKNIVLLAVEKRQIDIYQLLLKKTIPRDSVFGHVDKDGNSALHLAAKLAPQRPGMIPGLQMLWEIRWYQFVKDSMPPYFFPLHNKKNKTPIEIFTKNHSELVTSGGKWVSSTSKSSSVVATLVASVAFATAATIPGGLKQDYGTPMYENQPAFYIFAISSLFALFVSITSVVMFFALMSSPYEARDFSNDVPEKLLMSLMTLFMGIASMVISFCAAHFFLLQDKQKTGALVSYAVVVALVTSLTIKNSSVFLNLLRVTFSDVPQRLYEDDF